MTTGEARDYINVTDASAERWGALARWSTGDGFQCQQRLVNNPEGEHSSLPRNETPHLTAKHSVHVDSAAALRPLKLLYRRCPEEGQK